MLYLALLCYPILHLRPLLSGASQDFDFTNIFSYFISILKIINLFLRRKILHKESHPKTRFNLPNTLALIKKQGFILRGRSRGQIFGLEFGILEKFCRVLQNLVLQTVRRPGEVKCQSKESWCAIVESVIISSLIGQPEIGTLKMRRLRASQIGTFKKKELIKIAYLKKIGNWLFKVERLRAPLL
ncbi:hypothetical protein BpHYR1_036605 [Brachionus plicatilis]|uniref:Uncharacterized protein n=1 Tax=Brachionus plicatilis TaxID=10195 RepID=A0A3M7T394_BRAPC|nr:hypothetical protein BpHYR1_036605 [Brachionus plicatilis]